MFPLFFGVLLIGLLILGWGIALGLAFVLIRQRRSTAPASPELAPPSRRRDEPETYRAIEWKGMIFRSNSEIKIAKTLDHRGIFFIAATRARMSAGKNDQQTSELDFVICCDGKWGILEVDGPYHVAKVDAERDRLLRTHGITNIQRFPADRCYREPQAVIDEFLHHLENMP